MALGIDDASSVAVTLTLGQWNQMQQNFLIYQYGSILMSFALVGLIFLFKTFWPVVIAKWSPNRPLVGILQKDNRIVFDKDCKIINGVFYYKEEPEPFVKIYPGNFFFTGAPWQLLKIDLDAIQDPRYKLLKKRIQSYGYPNIDFLEEGLLFSAMEWNDPRAHEIMRRHGMLEEEKRKDDLGHEIIVKLTDEEYKDRYREAKKILNPSNLNYKSDIVRPFFDAIPLMDLLGNNCDGYGEEPTEEGMQGEIDDRYQEMKPSEAMKRKISSLLPYGIFAIVVCGIVALVWKMFF